MKKAKISAVFSFLLGIVLISCTNPNLGQPPAEKNAKPHFSDSSSSDNQGSAPLASVEEDIYLDRTEQSPYAVQDSAQNANDTTVAVDDEIWRYLNLAYEVLQHGRSGQQGSRVGRGAVLF